MSLLPVLQEEDEEIQSDNDDAYPRRDSFAANRKRKSVYFQRQSIKPINAESIEAAQRKISLNRDYTGKPHGSNERRVSLTKREKLSKACHRPVIVPMVKIIGKVPGYVDVSELQALRREFAGLQKEYHDVVSSNLKDIHRRHMELMEIDKIKSERLRKRFIYTLKAYGISPSVITDVLAELIL